VLDDAMSPGGRDEIVGRVEIETGGEVGWREADRQLRRLAARRGALDAEEARWLLVGRREKVHERFGFGSFLEYVERVLGHRPHAARERLRVAEALAGLPATRAALERGGVSYTAVRELTRVATANTERAWLDAVAGKTARSRPSWPATPRAIGRTIRRIRTSSRASSDSSSRPTCTRCSSRRAARSKRRPAAGSTTAR